MDTARLVFRTSLFILWIGAIAGTILIDVWLFQIVSLVVAFSTNNVLLRDEIKEGDHE